MSRRAGFGIVAVVGFVLSPLSWWNDLLVNIPLAYLLATPFTLLDSRLFLPAFIGAYWLTNLLGLLLLHRGTAGVLDPKKRPAMGRTMLFAFLYTALIAVLVVTGVLPSPETFLR